MSVNESRPFMGRVEFDPDDPDLRVKIDALHEQAVKLGSNVVSLAYPGQPIRVYYGTNHDFQYTHEEQVS